MNDTEKKYGNRLGKVSKKYFTGRLLNKYHGVNLTLSTEVLGSSQFVGSFYRPPYVTDPDYLGQLETCLSRIPVGAHIRTGGNFNLCDIDWETDSIKPHANR